MAPELQLIFKADGSVVHNELEMKWISLCTEDEGPNWLFSFYSVTNTMTMHIFNLILFIHFTSSYSLFNLL